MTQTVNKIGKYEVVEVLGRGGMGVVYKAMDPRIGRLVAIKMMTGGFAENPDLLKRFYREAQSTGTLQHPNIVIVYDLGDQDGNPYLVMEFLEGESLEKMITGRRPMAMVRKLDIIIQVCQALNYAHARGIVHRDIKPANVMVLKDGSVKLVDFGIARIGGDSMTRTGQVVGTISYMSPEQINAQVVDGRTDIFSAGVMLFQLLTYALPFEGNDTASTLLKIIHEPPPPLAALIGECPPELEEIIGRALAKDRELRYATAEDFAFDLSRVREALKRNMVNEYVDQAQALVGKSELAKAKELLVEVLKVDTQHSNAKQLLNQVQQMMQRQQRGEQVRQLRALANDAIAHNLNAEALSYLDQAIALDATSMDLGDLRKQVQEALERQKKLEDALRRAEAAQQVDDLDKAVAAAGEAIDIDPHNTRAVALHSAIVKEVEARRKERELHNLIDEAKRDISSRKFTSAFEVLKKAEQLDPSAPEVHALMNLASSGREQEQKRRELEKFNNEIQDAINRDDDAAAMKLCDEALLKFPSEANLLKLKKMAEKRQEANQKRRFIDEQMAAARKLLEAGQAGEALRTLEESARKIPGDTRIQSLLAIVRESAEREKLEKRKAEFVQEAKASLRSKDYKSAVATLERALSEVEESAEIQDLLQFARDEMAQAERRAKIEAAAEEAQKLIAAQEYDRAESLLTATMQNTPDEELKYVLAEVKRAKEGLQKSIEGAMNRARRLLEMRKPDEAVALLESQPKSYGQSAEFCRVVEQARDELEKFKRVQAAVQAAEAAAARDDFSGAHQALDAARATIGDAAELKDVGAQLSARRLERVKSVVERAVRDGRMLLLARQYDAAVRMLDDVANVVKHAPDDLKKQYEALRKDATAGAARTTAPPAPAAGATIVAGSATPAHTVIAGSTGEGTMVSPAPAAAAVPAASAPAAAPAKAAPAAVPAPAKRAPAPVRYVEPEPAKKKSFLIPAIVAVVVIIAAVGGYLAMKSGTSAPVADSFIVINAVPWATVKSVEPADGGSAIITDQQTPVRVPVAAGTYKVTLVGPNNNQRIDTVVVSADKPGDIYVVFEEIDVDSILQTH